MTYIPDELYHAIAASLPIACVDVAIFNEGKVLLAKRTEVPAKGQWWFPGGRILKGETMRETAARKAREEVGLLCAVGPLVATSELFFPDGPGGSPAHTICSCFLLSITRKSGPVALDKTQSEYRWVGTIPADAHPFVALCLERIGLDRNDV